MRGQSVHAESTPGSEHSGLKSETPGPGKSHTLECKNFKRCQRRESRRTATVEEVKRGDEVDQDSRPLDPSSSSTDHDPNRFRRAAMTWKTWRTRWDENISLRTPATSHPLDPDAEEYKLLRWIGYFFDIRSEGFGARLTLVGRISYHIPKTSKFAYVLTLKEVYRTRRQKWYDEQTEHSRVGQKRRRWPPVQ